MNNNSLLWSIATICVFFVLVFHTAIVTKVIPALSINSSWATAGALLASTGLYIAIFKLLTFLFRKYLWKLFMSNIDCSGYWDNEVYDESEVNELIKLCDKVLKGKMKEVVELRFQGKKFHEIALELNIPKIGAFFHYYKTLHIHL